MGESVMSECVRSDGVMGESVRTEGVVGDDGVQPSP